MSTVKIETGTRSSATGSERNWPRHVIDWLQVNGVWAYLLGMVFVGVFQYLNDQDFSRRELVGQAAMGVLGLIGHTFLQLDRTPTVPDRVVKKRLRELFQFGELPEVDRVYEALSGAGPSMERYRRATDRYFIGGGSATEYRAWMAKKLGV